MLRLWRFRGMIAFVHHHYQRPTMLRSLLLLPLLTALVAQTAPPPQAPPLQTGRWVQTALEDWLPGVFTNTYVDGGGLRLQPEQRTGEFTSAAFQAPFGFNAGVIETVIQASAGQTVTLELRSSLDGQNWRGWQRLVPVVERNGVAVSEFVAFPSFTSWLQYRVTLAADSDSPIVDELATTFVNSTAGPALVDVVSRAPLQGPTTQTPPPAAISRADWSGGDQPTAITRQRPQRIELTQLRVPVDDPNGPATLRAYAWVVANSYGERDLPFHYFVNGTGTLFEGQPSASTRLPVGDSGVVRVALLADAEGEGVSEAAEATLTELLGWLTESYRLAPDAITVAAAAPAQLIERLPAIRAAADRAVVRYRRFFPEGSPGNGPERLVLVNQNAAEARATLVGYTDQGEQRRILVVPAGQRVDVDLNAAFADTASLGLTVLADRALLAERTQIAGRELLGSAGVGAPRRSWFWAAGATTDGTQTYLLIVNPQAAPAEGLLTFFGETGTLITKTVNFAPQARTTLLLNDLVPDQRFGLKLVTTQAVVAERSAFATNGAATLVVGSPTLNRRWFFAEGVTTTGFTTTLHLLNPWPQQIAVAVQVLSEDGTTVSRRYAVPPQRAVAVSLNEVAPDLPFAITVQGERPLLVERELRFSNGLGATAGLGASVPAVRWRFAEGSTAPPAVQFLLVANPNRAAVNLEITYTLADGTTQRFTREMPPTSRLSIAANTDVPDQPVLSTVITASRPVVAERSIYVQGVDGIGGETSLGISDE